MNPHLLRKIGWALFTIVFVLVLNFFLFRILPGDPARSVKDPRLTQEAIAAMQARFGLDKPLSTQFFLYVRNLLAGDLGISFHQQRPVAQILGGYLWNTVLLVGTGTVLAIFIGILLGVVAAWQANRTIDYVAQIGSLVAWSMPTFWFGMILLFLGSRYASLPIAGMVTPGANYNSFLDRWLDVGRHMLLPTLTYAIIYAGEYTLFMRSAMLDIFSEDYILTAKAKGLQPMQILRDHALPNAMLPTVTVVALNLGYTVAGAITLETVFSWPGLGRAVVEAVGRQDYPVLQGAFLLLAVSVILANLVADVVYGYLDPRVGSE